MSQIPDIFEQIDEELDADRAREAWEKNRGFIITVLVIFFLGLFAYVGWQNYAKKRDQAASTLFLSAVDVGGDEGRKTLETLINDYAGHGYEVVARLERAQQLAAAGEVAAALRDLESVAQSGAAPTVLKEMAWLTAAWMAADEPLKARLYLAKIGPNSSYRPAAMELTGLLLEREGKAAEALSRYTEARNLKPEGPLAERLNRRITRLAPAS